MRATLRSVGKRSAFILAASAALLLAPATRGATVTWDGGGADDLFTTAANWVGNVAPPNNGTADLVFAGTTRLAPQLTVVGADLSVNSISFASGAGAFTLTTNLPGGNLVIGAGGIANNDNNVQTITTGFAADLITASGNQAWNANSSALTIGMFVNLQGNLTLGGSFAKTFTAGFGGNAHLTIAAGTLNLTATQAGGDTSVILQSGATLSVQADQATGSGLLFLEGGTLQTAVSSTLNNSEVILSAGTIILSGTGSMGFAGSMTVVGGSSAVLNITNTNAVGVAGGLALNAGTALTRTGTAATFFLGDAFSSSPANSIAGTLNLNSGTTKFFNATNLTSGGSLNINGAGTAVTSSGDLTVGSGASVNVNAGTFTFSPGVTVTVNGGTLTSAVAGAIVFQNGAVVIQNGGKALLTGSLVAKANQTFGVTGQSSLLSVTGDFQLEGGNTMNVTAGGDLTAAGRLVVGNNSADTLLVDGAGSKLTIGGASASASVLGTANKGTLTIGNFATGTIGNTFLVGNNGAGSRGELNVLGAAQLTVNADLSIGSFANAGTSGAVLLDGLGATLTVAGANNVTTVGAASGSTASLTVSNGASFIASSAAGGGTVLNNTGTITIDGGSANLGALTRNGGGDIVFNSGSLSYVGNLTVNVAGLLGQGLNLAANRTLTLSGTTLVDPEQFLTVSGGSLTTGSLTTNGAFNMSAGTTTLTSGALTAVSFDGILLASATISGTGNLNLSSAGAIAGNLGTITISGATLDAGTAPLTANSGGAFVYQGNALINGGILGGTGTHTIGTGGARFTGGTLATGSTLAQNAAATVTDFTIAGVLNSAAPLTMAGSTSVPGVLNLNVNSGFAIANGPLTVTGGGTVNIFSGAALSANAPVVANSGGGIAILAGGGFYPTAGLTLDGGVLVRVAAGFFDPGAFTIKGGGHATFDGGFDYGTAHTTTVTGGGSQFDVTNGDLFVDAGSTMNILAGAHATASGRLVISNLQSGAMLVDGAGSQLTAQGLNAAVSVIGSQATGTLTISNGASVTIGNDNYIGNSPATSNGTVSVQSGGHYTSNADVRLANFAAAIVGVIDVSGSGSTFTISGPTSNLLAGAAAASGSTATINVGTGATFTASQDAGGGVTLNPTATLNVNGGTANLGPLTFAGGHINLNSGTLSYTGGLTVGAAGELGANVTLSAGRNLAITGATSVPAGQSLTVNGGTFSTSSVTVAGTASVSGGGVLTTDSLVVNAPGVFTLGAGGTLDMPFGDITLGINGASVVFSGSTYSASFNTLNSQFGSNITYEGGARIFGGFLKGQGTHTVGALSGGPAGNARFTGTTLLNGATLQQANPARFTNFTGSGTINSSANLVWDGGALTSSGVLNVSSTVGVLGFESSGVITLASGSSMINSIGNLVLGGGSRTTIASGASITPQAGTNIQLNGGLLTNNGTVSGTLNVNYGSLAKGAGTFGTVNVADGGRFSPGNSPGTASLASMTFAPGSRYDFELNSALAIAGTGSDLLSISGVLAITAGTTPNSQFTIGVTTLNLAGQSAPLSDFDPAQQYHFLLANASGGISGFTTGQIALDLIPFANSYTGTFGVSTSGNGLYLDYTPVPEPSGAVLLLLGGLAAAAHRRRGKADQAAMPQ